MSASIYQPTLTPAQSAALVNARGAAQALVFDAIANNFVAVAGNPANVGAGDITVATPRFSVRTLSLGATLVGGSGTGFFALYVNAAASVRIVQNGTSEIGFPSYVFPTNTPVALAMTRTGGVATLYANGVQVSSVACTQTWGGTSTTVGLYTTTGSEDHRTIGPVFILNRALSAAEVLALYQQSTPAAADYAGGLVNTTITAGAFVVGRRYRILALGTTNFTLVGASASTVGVEFVATGVGTGTGTATAIGLLCAPDAGQVGAGLQWLDASGQRAHFLLPTSGVRWSLPDASGQIVVEATVVHSGAGNIQLGGGSIIDTSRQWRIVSISANSTAIATVTLGNVSAGAQHVASGALAVGNNARTIVSGAGNFLSTANLWSGSGAAATIRYVIVLSGA